MYLIKNKKSLPSYLNISQNCQIHVFTGNTLEKTCYYCNNGQPFTTYDRDNDNYKGNCAVWAKGGWWHNGCQNSCLNGLYRDSGYAQGVNWEDWKNLKYSFKSSLMKVRRSL